MCVDYANTMAFYYHGLEHAWALPSFVGVGFLEQLLSRSQEITGLYKMRRAGKVSAQKTSLMPPGVPYCRSRAGFFHSFHVIVYWISMSTATALVMTFSLYITCTLAHRRGSAKAAEMCYCKKPGSSSVCVICMCMQVCRGALNGGQKTTLYS